jgi:hypothetical protein
LGAFLYKMLVIENDLGLDPFTPDINPYSFCLSGFIAVVKAGFACSSVLKTQAHSWIPSATIAVETHLPAARHRRCRPAGNAAEK